MIRIFLARRNSLELSVQCGSAKANEGRVDGKRWATSLRGALFASTALMAAYAGLVTVTNSASALPTAGNVVDGSANIVYGDNSVVIEQGSDRVIIEWESFDIGVGEVVNFVQPSDFASALNRVLNGGTTEILGALSANGQIVISNPAGINFGASAQVDVGSIVATSLDIMNDRFMAGEMVFDRPGNADAVVENHGSINASGLAALVAPGARNSGTIVADVAVLGGGQGFALDLYGDGLVSFAITDPTETVPVGADGEPVDALVVNDGTIIADGGQVVLTADAAAGVIDQTINMSGVIIATSIEAQNGQVALVGGDSGTVQVSGTIDASGNDAGEVGGTVNVIGDVVELSETAVVDVSGAAGGGVAVIGGGAAGVGSIAYIEPAAGASAPTVVLDPASVATVGYVPEAAMIYWDAGATVSADATVSGSGGAVAAAAVDQVHLLGEVTANGVATGGSLTVAGDVVFAGGTMSADGADGGTVAMEARFLLAYGDVSAAGTAGTGGSIALDVSGRYLETAAASFNAGGVTEGGNITIGGTAEIYASGAHDVTASAGHGGEIVITGSAIDLFGAQLTAHGSDGGGRVFIGDVDGDGNGTIADTVALGADTVIGVDATQSGDGGEIWIWSTTSTSSIATLTARGGDAGGDGGFIEVSSHGEIGVGGSVDAGAANGVAGTLLLDPHTITIGEAQGWMFNLTDPGSGGSRFGSALTTLSNGNIAVGASSDDAVATDAGAVYLFNASGTLLSTLTGSTVNDQVGGGLVALSNGNFVVRSSVWNNGAVSYAGAVTWIDGSVGLTGVVSAANSLVGSTTSDTIGGQIVEVGNGNYVVLSTAWDDGATADVGAATWADGSTGLTGPITSTNSLIGSVANSAVGQDILVLSNGNYLVLSERWVNGSADDAGAVTFGLGASGVTGVISAANSIVGSSTNDKIGWDAIEVGTSDAVVWSRWWNSGRGAVTWIDGDSGRVGVVDSTNSLVGSAADHEVGYSGVIALSDGNYVVSSPNWDNGGTADVGAVTWGDGSTGTVGVVSTANSLVGSVTSDQVGNKGAVALTNGRYVIRSDVWTNGAATNAGAVTWADAGGITGAVSSANSLVGSTSSDRLGYRGVTVLTNGNYVVMANQWDNGSDADVGAAVWADGTTGISGTISSSNALIGSTAGDQVGSVVVALTNGNYVVASLAWDNDAIADAGAVTWGDGAAGITGSISASNSLVGSQSQDYVGDGVVALTNGNFVASSRNWDNGGVANVGAVTWGDGTTGITGTIDSTNSLIGSSENDYVGVSPTIALANGNYVVRSQVWDNGSITDAGAATWGDGTSGTAGVVSAANSLVGTSASDKLGENVLTLDNGDYLVWAQDFDDLENNVADVNVFTLVNGATGLTLDGVNSPTSSNSLIGTDASHFPTSHIDNDNNRFIVASYGTGGSDVAVLSTDFSGPVGFDDLAATTLRVTPSFLTDTLNAGTNLVLQANSDVIFDSAVEVNNAGGGGGALTVQAGRSILINEEIITDNGDLTLIANETAANGVVDAHRDAGDAVITLANGAWISAGTGTVLIEIRDGAGLTHNGNGAITLGGTTVDGGSVTVSNLGEDADSDVRLHGLVRASDGGAAIVLSTLNGALANDGVYPSPLVVNPGASVVLYAPTIASNAFDAAATSRMFEATILTHPVSGLSLSDVLAVYAAAGVSPGTGGGTGTGTGTGTGGGGGFGVGDGGTGPVVPMTVTSTVATPSVVMPIIVQPGAVPGVQSDVGGVGVYLVGGPGGPGGVGGGLSGGGLLGSGASTGDGAADGGPIAENAGGLDGGSSGDGSDDGTPGSASIATNGQGDGEQTVVSGIVPCGDADNQVSLVCAQ